MTKIASNESKISKCIKAPYRALLKARDLYVKSMMDCSGGVSYGGVSGVTPTSLPKSYSTSTTYSRSSSKMSSSDYDDEDYRELIRAASQRDQKIKSLSLFDSELKAVAAATTKKSSKDGLPPLPRSFTVGIGRIDEDKPCDEFEDESFMVMKKTDGFYPRSKSYAVTKRTTHGHGYKVVEAYHYKSSYVGGGMNSVRTLIAVINAFKTYQGWKQIKILTLD